MAFLPKAGNNAHVQKKDLRINMPLGIKVPKHEIAGNVKDAGNG